MRKKEHHKLGGGSAVSTVRLVKEELEIPGNTGNELLSVLQEALTEQFHRAEFWGRGHRARGRERDEVWDELEKLRALSKPWLLPGREDPAFGGCWGRTEHCRDSMRSCSAAGTLREPRELQ